MASDFVTIVGFGSVVGAGLYGLFMQTEKRARLTHGIAATLSFFGLCSLVYVPKETPSFRELTLKADELIAARVQVQQMERLRNDLNRFAEPQIDDGRKVRLGDRGGSGAGGVEHTNSP